MSRRNTKPEKLPFDNRGGAIVIRTHLFNSPEYERLSLKAKFLMIVLQEKWKNDKPVAFGVREAAARLGCRLNAAGTAFTELQNAGFIKVHCEARFSSRSGSRAREWRLTWMPFNSQPPTHDWEKATEPGVLKK